MQPALIDDSRRRGVGPAFAGVWGAWKDEREMQGLRKIGRALAIAVLPVVGGVVLYESTSTIETGIGLALKLSAALVQPLHLRTSGRKSRSNCEPQRAWDVSGAIRR